MEGKILMEVIGEFFIFLAAIVLGVQFILQFSAGTKILIFLGALCFLMFGMILRLSAN